MTDQQLPRFQIGTPWTSYCEQIKRERKKSNQNGPVDYIRDIAGFSFRVNCGPNPIWKADEFKKNLVAEYTKQRLQAVLAESKIYFGEQISFSSSSDRIRLRIGGGDPYDCLISLSEDDFSIEYSGGKLDHFVTWYFRFMSHASALFEDVRQFIVSKYAVDLNPTSSEYSFNFRLTTIKHNGQSKSNIDVLTETFMQRQSIVSLESDINTNSGSNELRLPFYRMDLDLSVLMNIYGKLRNVWIAIKCPYNDRGAYFDCKFSVYSRTLPSLGSASDPHVEGFDPSSIDDYSFAFHDFLVDRMILGFLAEKLAGYEFVSTQMPFGSA